MGAPTILEASPTLRQVKLAYAKMIYEATGRNKCQAAKVLGIHRVTLHQMLADPEINNQPPVTVGAAIIDALKSRTLIVEAQDALETLLDKFDQQLRGNHDDQSEESSKEEEERRG